MVRIRASVMVLVATLALTVGIAPALAKGKHDQGKPGKGDGVSATHSLRAPVTDQNFYFVMADRFQNGDDANDNGGLPPGTDEGESGFDPTRKGWYHGGDLEGLLGRVDYIEGLGTTAIWLTPSFKNKAVQDNRTTRPPATTATGSPTSRRSTRTWAPTRICAPRRRRPRARHQGLLRHHHQPHGRRHPVPGGRRAAVHLQGPLSRTATASAPPFDDRDYADGSTFPALAPTGQPSCPARPTRGASPTARASRTPSALKVPAWLNDVSLYHNRGDTTFVGENSLYGDFFGLDDLFTENPRVVDGMIDIYKAWIRDFRIDGFRMDTMKHVDDEFWQKFSPGSTLREVAGDRRLLHVRRGRGGLQPAVPLALHGP